MNPAFISVTYGAGGNTADSKTCQIASVIQDKYNITSAAHLTCVNCTKNDIDVILGQLKEKGIQNILALRGDINPDIPPKHDFKYASELVTYIKEHGDFSVSGACYPEGHMETESIIDDIKHLKIKVDAGADHLMSQLFLIIHISMISLKKQELQESMFLSKQVLCRLLIRIKLKEWYQCVEQAYLLNSQR